MVVEKGYKLTEVGVIPEDWELQRLINLSKKIGDGIHSTPVYDDNGEYYFVNGNNLFNGKIVIPEETKKVNKLEFALHKRDIDNSTLLISINGTIGNIAFFNNEKIVLGKSAAFINLIDKLDKRFFYQLIQSQCIKKYFENELTGSTIKNLGLGSIRNTPIPLPPLHEQTAIANALSDMDALIAKTEKLIEKKKAIKQGVMQELLKPKEGWVTKKLGEVCEIIGGGTPSTLNSLFWNGDIKWFTPSEVGKDKYLTSSKRKITYLGLCASSARVLPAGTILITTRASIGDLGILIFDAATNQGFQSLIPKTGVNNEFVYYLMLTKKSELLKNASGSTFLEISPNKLKSIEVALPTIEKQNEIASIFKEIDQTITLIESKLQKLKNQKQGMMQALLTGKIRLV
jgi:type I restriction enzyme S subunit